MTDIQKMVEDESENFMARNVVFGCASTDIQDAFRLKAFISGANFALSKLQHENRWRKVSEELPDPYIAVLCRIKNPNIIIEGYIYEDNGIVKVATDGFEIYPYDNGEVTEWKPI